MQKICTLIAGLFFCIPGFSQSWECGTPITIPRSWYQPAPAASLSQLQEYIPVKKVAVQPAVSPTAGITITCAQDSVRYTNWKATNYRFLSINTATSAQGLGQYYDCPQPMTVLGMEFYGYTPGAITNVVCGLYYAGPDSMPVGTALALDTITVDSNYGFLTLPEIRRVASFGAGVLVDKPYVITFNNFTTINTTVLCNDWDFTDGDSEWLACGDFRNLGGTWTRSYDMNVGGVPFNADGLINPIVVYDNDPLYVVDKTCNISGATLSFTDFSSPVLMNRMYNSNVASGVTANSFGWNFGDGSPITFAINPTHLYSTAGPYTTTLFTTVAGWSYTCIANTSIPVGGAGDPVANFFYAQTGATVDFTSVASGATSWTWDFGDGGTSTTTSPSHTYTANGTYAVTLIVDNICGSDTLVDSVTIVCDFPVASFGANQPSMSLLVAFHDSSSGSITSWQWIFGDGGTSTLQNPFHAYPAFGYYTVTLIVSGECGSDTLTDTVHVVNPVAIQDNHEEPFLHISPNPSSDRITVFWAKAPEELRLVDLTGRTYYTFAPDPQSKSVNLSVQDLAKGMYLLVWRSGDKTGSAKIIRE